jgi:hypothetical protein
MCNNIFDEACPDLKIRWKRRWKFYAKTLANKPTHENRCVGLTRESCESIYFAYC